MLGRQQIADVSTAISELFKNAHDAYADHVEVDYFRSDNLLVLRDDGIGMTKEEFENRWLVLGTESKLDAASHNKMFKPSGKSPRQIMGEKGIGRLAIALLGSQVLVLTRGKRESGLSDLTMCFIHWGLFELPSLNLDDLDFPVVSITGGKLPSEKEVVGLVAQNRFLVESLQEKYPQSDFSAIANDMQDFQLDPMDLDEFLKGLSLKENGTGTHFFIAPANPEIRTEIERERQTQTKEFSRFLLGFCNATFCTDTPPPIEPSFRYWASDLAYEELIGSGEFFTKEDVACGDQYIRGEVNEYGQFSGIVRVYEKEYKDHVISWGKGGGKPTFCGPFQIEFAYLQGTQRESRTSAEEYVRIRRKLDCIAGLYVYRDGIRILPYGNSDVDWLDMELRRSKHAGHYFFSYRNLYGAVCLSRENNTKLKEKAGREGFQKDKAYRQLKEILENLFIQLAADFFRKEAEFGDYFRERKAELDRLERARKKRDKQAGTKKKNLAKALDSFFQKITQKLPEGEVDVLRLQIHARMKVALTMENQDEAAEELLEAENEANSRLNEIRKNYQVAKPRGIGLTKQLQRDWTAYQQEQERLESEVFSPFSKEVSEGLGKMAEEARLYIDQRRRLKKLIKQVSDNRESKVKSEAAMLEKTAAETRRIAIDTARKSIQEFRNIVKKVEIEFAEQDFSDLSPQSAEAIREKYELQIKEVGQKNTDSLGRVREMLTGISENLQNSGEVEYLDVVEAMDQELQELKEQADTDAELVQLGLAVAVINHEFEAAIKGIRRKLSELGSWARANDDLVPLYQEIRTNFDHLDAHLNLFTPLQRRLQRKRIFIKGSEINHYVRTLFTVRLKRHDIELSVTQEFLDSNIQGFPSAIYPVFVNIIDNAIFWLKDIQGRRNVTLDFSGNAYQIRNNGPSIHKRDMEAIFEQGFSRKPGGRGLGLFISKKALKKEGMDLNIGDSAGTERGVIFEILCPEGADE
ncbi:MAG: ATP-binding protein [Candidatus Electrothrix aestuarii]|uniref:histidine kinase n=1 Tax=Candidatus Electrothrix aestuarii TaxID=3062594 RepID=A0AAU8LXC7_9BACT|nr:ATP-binding protein [Candidatus Electrothrix aestuarii]